MLKGTLLVRQTIQEKETWKGDSVSKAEDQTSLEEAWLQPTRWQSSLGEPAHNWTIVTGPEGKSMEHRKATAGG